PIEHALRSPRMDHVPRVLGMVEREVVGHPWKIADDADHGAPRGHGRFGLTARAPPASQHRRGTVLIVRTAYRRDAPPASRLHSIGAAERWVCSARESRGVGITSSRSARREGESSMAEFGVYPGRESRVYTIDVPAHTVPVQLH